MSELPSTMIILNPAARGDRAVRLEEEIARVAPEATVRTTTQAGDAARLAREAVAEGYAQVVAAGGDGTINEIVNGLAGSDTALGLLPAGTMNVFACELGLPRRLAECWEVIRAGHVREIDLPTANGHAFVQLAGVGFDAQVVQATSRQSKKSLGPLSYLISMAQVAGRKPPRLRVELGDGVPEEEGAFVLIGNGRFYGGPFSVFTGARLDDGLLDLLIFRNVGYLDIMRYMHGILFGGTHVNLRDVSYLRTPRLRVSAQEEVPVEVDGELLGTAPVEFGFHPARLRVLAPPALPTS